MRWKFAFGLASDDAFFVTTRCEAQIAGGPAHRSRITAFPDENEFLGHLIRAGLRDDQTKRIVVAVLLAVAKPVSPPPWIVLDVTRRQMEMLRLQGDVTEGEEDEVDALAGKDLYLHAARTGSLPQFYDLLMQVPTAIAMLVGPEHRFTFVNASYLELVGARSAARVMGKPLREIFPELYGERAAEILDRVFETGRRHHGTEEKRVFYRERTNRIEEGYFNTVCQPICNAFGEVAGVMVQSTDVTEMVLARDVKEHRERLLYRQWAELDAIYRSAPVAMMLIDATDLHILRLNEKQAELLGSSISQLLGKPLLEVVRDPTELKRVLAQVLRGKPIQERIVEGACARSTGGPRYWLKSYTPTLSAAGKVESIILAGFEISEETVSEIKTVVSRELELTA